MRHIAWFSCGAASAVAAKLALDKYPDTQVVYCDTSSSEHPDNIRFMRDIESWLKVDVRRLKSEHYSSIDDVFEATRYMSGIAGARCTTEMKKLPRFNYQLPDDVHVFGFTAGEAKRIVNFRSNNPDMKLDSILWDRGITKQMCLFRIYDAGIKLPAMYSLGYKNNNCIGCVKATSPAYWSSIRRDFPEVFYKRARLSRAIGCRLTRVKGKRIFLDELPLGYYGNHRMENISCGPDCAGRR